MIGSGHQYEKSLLEPTMLWLSDCCWFWYDQLVNYVPLVPDLYISICVPFNTITPLLFGSLLLTLP